MQQKKKQTSQIMRLQEGEMKSCVISHRWLSGGYKGISRPGTPILEGHALFEICGFHLKENHTHYARSTVILLDEHQWVM